MDLRVVRSSGHGYEGGEVEWIEQRYGRGGVPLVDGGDGIRREEGGIGWRKRLMSSLMSNGGRRWVGSEILK